MMKSNLVDLELSLHATTEKAILVSVDGDGERSEWLPKSQIEYQHRSGAIVEVTLPESLAVEKGLV